MRLPSDACNNKDDDDDDDNNHDSYEQLRPWKDIVK